MAGFGRVAGMIKVAWLVQRIEWDIRGFVTKRKFRVYDPRGAPGA